MQVILHKMKKYNANKSNVVLNDEMCLAEEKNEAIYRKKYS